MAVNSLLSAFYAIKCVNLTRLFFCGGALHHCISLEAAIRTKNFWIVAKI